MAEAKMKIFEFFKTPRGAMELGMYMIAVFVGGWVFHQNVLEALDVKVQAFREVTYPRDSGEFLEKKVTEMDDKLNKRLDVIEGDIKELLRRK